MHPGGYSAIPRVLGHYFRDEGWFDLSEAIRKATSLPAERLRLPDRGRLAPGYAADIVLFEPGQIGERGTWMEPDRKPTGIHVVLLTGSWSSATERAFRAGPAHCYGTGVALISSILTGR